MMFHSIKRLGRKTYKEQTLQLIFSVTECQLFQRKMSPSNLSKLLQVKMLYYDFSLYKNAPEFTHMCLTSLKILRGTNDLAYC
jgi:hypothetical protein